MHLIKFNRGFKLLNWCREAESNRRHEDFQSYDVDYKLLK